ncbi:MAG: hypothetical protein QXW09_04340 [Thermoproteota archaeon]
MDVGKSDITISVSLIVIIGLLLLAGVTWYVSAEVWREKREPTSGYKYGPRGSGAWAWVGGWWWGTAYCGFGSPQGGFYLPAGYTDPGMYSVTIAWDLTCGNPYAWVSTTVKLKVSGIFFTDSYACARI